MKTEKNATKQEIINKMKELDIEEQYLFKESSPQDKGAIFFEQVQEKKYSFPKIFVLRNYPSNYAAYIDMKKGWHPDPRKDIHNQQLTFFELDEQGSATKASHKKCIEHLQVALSWGSLYLSPTCIHLFNKLITKIRNLKIEN